jgi:hypothetical protein
MEPAAQFRNLLGERLDFVEGQAQREGEAMVYRDRDVKRQ